MKDALSVEACGIVMMSSCNPNGNYMESAQNRVFSPVHCTLMTVSALLHPCEVHLGTSCLPLHLMVGEGASDMLQSRCSGVHQDSQIPSGFMG